MASASGRLFEKPVVTNIIVRVRWSCSDPNSDLVFIIYYFSFFVTLFITTTYFFVIVIKLFISLMYFHICVKISAEKIFGH